MDSPGADEPEVCCPPRADALAIKATPDAAAAFRTAIHSPGIGSPWAYKLDLHSVATRRDF